MNPLLDLSARPVIAHRGASAEAPENTLEALRLAATQGCDAFEVDVRLTRDGVPVLLHDPSLERTSGRPGMVRALTLGELQAADPRIPTLAQVLREFPAMPILIEIKAPESQHAVARLLEAEGATDRCVVASFRAWALAAFRKPPFLVGASRPDILLHMVLTRLRLPTWAPRCRCFAVPDFRSGYEIPLPRFVAEARAHGRPVHVWTVDDPERAQTLWGRGVSGIITNRPALMREVRDNWNKE